MSPERDARDTDARRRVAGDQDIRDKVVGDLGTTFLLEASAGTGKTSVLVDRYVNCVLDAERGTGDVRRVAAITFTEKAAGELRQRIREELEQRAVEVLAGSDEVTTIQTALDALDDAPIGTIHGFAGRLLREFPVEARVDPAFEQLDALGSEIERGRLWEEWLTELAAGDQDQAGVGQFVAAQAVAAQAVAAQVDADEADVGPLGASSADTRRWLSRLLRAGVKLGDVHDLAAGPRGVFGERYDVDPPRDRWASPTLPPACPGWPLRSTACATSAPRLASTPTTRAASPPSS